MEAKPASSTSFPSKHSRYEVWCSSWSFSLCCSPVWGERLVAPCQHQLCTQPVLSSCWNCCWCLEQRGVTVVLLSAAGTVVDRLCFEALHTPPVFYCLLGWACCLSGMRRAMLQEGGGKWLDHLIGSDLWWVFRIVTASYPVDGCAKLRVNPVDAVRTEGM